MSKYFLSSVRFDKMNDNGVVKKVTEQYLLDAVNYTEAETRTTEELTPLISGEFEIVSIIKPRISEVVNADSKADYFYKVTSAFVTINEKTGVEEQTKTTCLVRADNFDEAVGTYKDFMKNTISDWEMLGCTQTAIVDFYPYKPAEEK